MADEKKRRIPLRPRLDDDEEEPAPLRRPARARAVRDEEPEGDEDEDLVGPRSRARRPRPEPLSYGDDLDDDLVGPRSRPSPRVRGSAPRREARPPRGARRAGGERDWLRTLVREIPSFLKLLWGLARDSRVSRTDKAIVVAVVGYALLPADLIPDWIPGLGEVEDVLLLALALSRLLGHAGEEVLMDHWDGDEETLEAVIEALDGATQLLPSPIRGLIGGRR